MSFTKFIVVVDEHVNVHDEQDVLFHLFSNCDPARDTEIVKGAGRYSRPREPRLGGREARSGSTQLSKLPAEGKVRAWPKELEMDSVTKDLVTKRWKEYGF